VDRFFDEVMVMAENEAVRRNRLALLAELLREFTTVADFSEIGAGE
jgi:glycyl-tRNA synthetase beta chain